MSTQTQPLSKNQAVILAADTLEALQEIPSVAEIAERAGMTRQYLYRLANAEIERRRHEKGGGRQDTPPRINQEANAIADSSIDDPASVSGAKPKQEEAQ